MFPKRNSVPLHVEQIVFKLKLYQIEALIKGVTPFSKDLKFSYLILLILSATRGPLWPTLRMPLAAMSFT